MLEDVRIVAPRQTRASQIAATRPEQVLDGTLAPGARLSLHQQRVRFGVSLSPVRRAIAEAALTRDRTPAPDLLRRHTERTGAKLAEFLGRDLPERA